MHHVLINLAKPRRALRFSPRTHFRIYQSENSTLDVHRICICVCVCVFVYVYLIKAEEAMMLTIINLYILITRRFFHVQLKRCWRMNSLVICWAFQGKGTNKR